MMPLKLKTLKGLTKRERKILKEIGLRNDEIFYMDWLKRKQQRDSKWHYL